MTAALAHRDRCGPRRSASLAERGGLVVSRRVLPRQWSPCSPGCGGSRPTHNGGCVAGYSAVALTWYIATSEAATVSLNIRHDRARSATTSGPGRSPSSCSVPHRCSACGWRPRSAAALPRLAVLLVAGAVVATITAGGPPRPAALALAVPSLVLADRVQHRRAARLRGSRVLAPRRRVGVVPLSEARVHPRWDAHPARGAARRGCSASRVSLPFRGDGVHPRAPRVGSRGAVPAARAGCWLGGADVVADRGLRCRRTSPPGGRRMRALLATLRNAFAEAAANRGRAGIADGGDDRQRRRLGRVLGAVLRPRRRPAAVGTAIASCCCWPSSRRRGGDLARAARQRPARRHHGGEGDLDAVLSLPVPPLAYRAAAPGRADEHRRPRVRVGALRRRGRADAGASRLRARRPASATLLTGVPRPHRLAGVLHRAKRGRRARVPRDAAAGVVPRRRVRGRPRSCSTRSSPRRSSRRCPRLIDSFDVGCWRLAGLIAAVFAAAGWATFTVGLRRYTSAACRAPRLTPSMNVLRKRSSFGPLAHEVRR